MKKMLTSHFSGKYCLAERLYPLLPSTKISWWSYVGVHVVVFPVASRTALSPLPLGLGRGYNCQEDTNLASEKALVKLFAAYFNSDQIR